MKHILTSILLLFLFCTPALGQVQSRGASIERFDNANAAFEVRVEVDKRDHVYTDGELLQVWVTSSENGFLYLFYRDADANVKVLFPNEFNDNNYIRRGVRTPVTGPDAGFRIRIGPPFGHELLTAVVSTRELPFIGGRDPRKFRIISVDDNAVNAFAEALEQEAREHGAATPDWAEHSINIITVPRGEPPRERSQTAKVHLVLAADINDLDNVGRQVWADAHNVRVFFEDNIASSRLNVVDLEQRRGGNLLTKNDMLQAIRNLNANSDDAIVFFFSGHGAIDSVAGQYFHLGSGDQVFRSEILDALKSQRARLTVLVSDCCSNRHDVEPSVRPRPPRVQSRGVGEIKGIRPLIETLFFEASGVVNITAAEDGTYGFIYPSDSRYEGDTHKGSVFTWNFRGVLNAEMNTSKNWRQIFPLVREATNEDYKQVFERFIQSGRVSQTELIPKYFSPLP